MFPGIVRDGEKQRTIIQQGRVVHSHIHSLALFHNAFARKEREMYSLCHDDLLTDDYLLDNICFMQEIWKYTSWATHCLTWLIPCILPSLKIHLGPVLFFLLLWPEWGEQEACRSKWSEWRPTDSEKRETMRSVLKTGFTGLRVCVCVCGGNAACFEGSRLWTLGQMLSIWEATWSWLSVRWLIISGGLHLSLYIQIQINLRFEVDDPYLQTSYSLSYTQRPNNLKCT